jgi:hypothetical protein
MSTQSQGFTIGQSGSEVQERESEGAWMDVKDELGEPMTYTGADGSLRPVRIKVAGTYSKQYRAVVDLQKSRMLKGKRVSKGEQLTDNQREAAGACCLEWEGFFAGAQPYECSIRAAMVLFQQAYWIQEQVEEQMQDHASFSKTSTNS